MGIETSTTIVGLNPNWPLGTDPRSEGDNHIRLIKSVLQLRFDDATGGILKFKDVWNLSLYGAGVRRGDWYASSGPTAEVLLQGRDAGGTLSFQTRMVPSSLDYMNDGDFSFRGMSLDGTKSKFALTWQASSGYAEISGFDPTTGARTFYTGMTAGIWTSTQQTYHFNGVHAPGGVAHYLWYDPSGSVRLLVDGAGDMYWQYTNADVSVITTYMKLNKSTRGLEMMEGSFRAMTTGQGLVMEAAGASGLLTGTPVNGVGLGTGPKNNIELQTWHGFGVRSIQDGVVRYAVDASNGQTRQAGEAFIGSSVIQGDGNIQFAGGMVGVAGGATLAEGLAFRAYTNNQTDVNATDFRVGVTLAAQVLGSEVRNGVYTLTLNNANSALFTVAGAPNAGTALAGGWRYCGLTSPGNGLFQRVS